MRATRKSFIAATLGALFLPCWGCERPEAADSRQFADKIVRVPTDRKVFLIGMDGLCWQVLDPLLRKGELPNIQKLIRQGVSGELATLRPTLSPIIWTSVITGKRQKKHNIKGFWHKSERGSVTRDAADQAQIERLKSIGYIGVTEEDRADESSMVLYTSASRRAKTLWNMLTEQNMTCDVLGWWVSYPAEAINGRMVTDRYLYSRFALQADERGSTFKGAGDVVSPPAFEEKVRPLVRGVDTVTAAEMHQFIGGEVELGDRMTLHSVEDELRIVFAKDESLFQMARMMLTEGTPDLFCLYFQGTDIASHYFWKYRFPEEWEDKYGEVLTESELGRYGEVINEYYKLQDRHLGELLECLDDKATVILCSDHGFVAGKRRPGGLNAAETVSGIHARGAPPGVIVMAGPGIRNDARISDAHILDIAPTILVLLGLPVGADLDGKVLTGALNDGVVNAGEGVRYVRSYETSAR